MSGLRLRDLLIDGAISAFGINVAALGIGFLAHLALARALGAEAYGTYAYVFTWVSLLSLLAMFGFQTALLRFATVYREQREWALLRSVIRYAELRVLMAGLLVAAIGILVVAALRQRMDPGLVLTFWIGLAAVPVLALLRIRVALARTFGRVASALAPDTLNRELTNLLFAMFAIALGLNITAPQAMSAMIFGTATGLLLITRTVWLARPPELVSSAIARSSSDWMRAALPLLLISAMQVLSRRADVMLLGWLIDTGAVGVYVIASRISDLVILPLTAINVVYAPRFAALFKRGDHQELQAVVTRTSRWITLAVVPASLAIFVLGEPILVLFGPEFPVAATTLRILLLAQCVNALCGAVGALMTMTGHEMSAAKVLGGTAILNVTANLLLIPQFGIEGAAIGSSTSIILWNLIMIHMVRKRLNISPGILGVRRPG